MSDPIVRLEVDATGVATVRVNNPPVNTIDAKVRRALFDALAQLQARDDLRAVVLACDGSTFFSGADIGEFSGPPKEEEYRTLFDGIENLPCPVVAAMHGTVMGGGFEIALACHYRVASPGTRFALPEVTLGIIPGAGGTQRLPRLIGVERTLEMVLSAKPVDTGTGQRYGFLDRVIEGDLLAGAVDYARSLADRGIEPRRTGRLAVDPASAGAEIVARFVEQANTQYRNRRAAHTAIEAVRAAVRLPIDEGLVYETKLVDEAKATIESKALVHLFFAERETRKVPDIPASAKARPLGSGGIVGAGTMGGGIAICFANAGIPVTVLDGSREALERGMANVAKTYDSMVRRGRLADDARARRMALITGTLDAGALGEADVVVEAVFEDLALKKQIFAKLDEVVKPGAVLATNTSTLDVNEIAAATRRPHDVVGLHFFSPANVMPLLEVVRTKDTSPEVIRTALELAKRLRKTPVLARVCYGFIGNRMMEGYAREAERMVLEGATPRQVDSALENWGMAMGILAVFDLAGIDIGVNVHRANAEKYPPDPTYYQADFALYDAGRLGQKTAKGYYRYEGRTRIDDPEAIEILRARAKALGVAQSAHDDTEILERCLYPLMNEGFRILGEGIAIRASDIDVVWAAGYGFPRYRGGPMFHAQTIGLPSLLDGIRRYRDRFGPMHWEPAPLLEELVAKGMTVADWERAKLAVQGVR
ncbi:MAG: 3-hydroxyacyl-CoA dehydrogenase NAD-binding domain-containing protein [Burkholderiaceae bacterium]|nr:3-hydroxyacyl-CoA dehydrogenase NAD-binding domain-containing protein [Burkholderiaceae bacterium]